MYQKETDFTTDFPLSLGDKLHSRWNNFAFHLRNRVAFSRAGYREYGVEPRYLQRWLNRLPAEIAQEARRITLQYGLTQYQRYLNIYSFQKTLATVWILEKICAVAPEALRVSSPILDGTDAGCQDFSRAVGIEKFFERFYRRPLRLSGIEIDAFPVLRDLHSRFDRGVFYASLLRDGKYLAADFFEGAYPSHLITAFYPFVSPHPALAWGLPLQLGHAGRWVNALERNLLPGGFVVVVHQGPWEEEEFCSFLEKQKPRELELVSRAVLNCPFYPTPHPAHVSIYRRGA